MYLKDVDVFNTKTTFPLSLSLFQTYSLSLFLSFSGWWRYQMLIPWGSGALAFSLPWCPARSWERGIWRWVEGGAQLVLLLSQMAVAAVLSCSLSTFSLILFLSSTVFYLIQSHYPSNQTLSHIHALSQPHSCTLSSSADSEGSIWAVLWEWPL